MSLRRTTSEYRKVVTFRVSLGSFRRRKRRIHPMRLRPRTVQLRALYLSPYF